MVELSFTGLAQVALTLGVRVVAVVFDDLRAVTVGTLYFIWPV